MLVDEEYIGDFAFTQKNRELFWRGSTIQSANLVQELSSRTVIIGKCTYNCVYAVKVFSFRFNFDYNGLYTMFYKIKQGIERIDTCFLSRRLLQQVHGLSNRCTFALANSLAGRFISRY